MKPWARAGVLVGLGLLAAYSSYRVVAHRLADVAAADRPEDALAWIPGHPAALLALADRQLRAGDHEAAVATATRLRQAAPLEGGALRILAQAADAAGDAAQARDLYVQAVALRPRDVRSRAWLAHDDLENGRYPQALEQLDKILRVSPGLARTLFPAMAQLSADPGFVEALVPVLARQPSWRPAFLRELWRSPYPQAAAAVMDGLGRTHALAPQEHAQWMEELLRQGQWNLAYAHWAGTLPAGARLTPVYNSGFGQVPEGRGFDWRLPALPGVTVTFESAAGAAGQAARIEFRGRPAAHAGLEQALLLAPGRYQLQARVRSDDLRSDRGLEWVVECAPGRRVLGRSDPLAGNSGWTTLRASIDVPEECQGQWLRLRNPAPPGPAQSISGRVWIDEVRIDPLPAPVPGAPAAAPPVAGLQP